MNKKGLVGMVLFTILFVLIIIAAFIVIDSDDKKHTEFCKENGFETYEKASFRWENSICIKIEDNYRVEKKYSSCGDKLCFIRDANVEVDE